MNNKLTIGITLAVGFVFIIFTLVFLGNNIVEVEVKDSITDQLNKIKPNYNDCTPNSEGEFCCYENERERSCRQFYL